MIPLRCSLKRPTRFALLLAGALLSAGLSGCGSSDDTVNLAPDLAPPAVAGHNIHGIVALKADAQGVGVFAQNGVFAHIAQKDIIGKGTAWVILKGGDQIANGKMLEIGTGVIDDQLRFEFTTTHGYPDGPFELSLLILLKTTDLAKAPTPGDLASFDLSPPPAGEPPATGTSVRVRLSGADTMVTLSNTQFIRL